jgi:multidrug efflux pump subunit AcrB
MRFTDLFIRRPVLSIVVIRLGEIADVVLGSENYDQEVRFNGQSATFMGIWVLPGGGDFPVDFVIASAAEPQELKQVADRLVQKANASGLFIFAEAGSAPDRDRVQSGQTALAGR